MKNITVPVFSISAALILLSGCASYKAASLNNLESTAVVTPYINTKNEDVIVVAKAFNKADCKRYLDRDVLKKGYQPVQLYIQNNTDKSYSFSLNRISLPCENYETVAHRVHTSTVGRSLGYGIPGLLLAWPLLIPAVVDGIKSSEANERLDNDFASKVARDQTLLPYSSLNKIIFVKTDEYQRVFNLTVTDQQSNEPMTFNVIANG